MKVILIRHGLTKLNEEKRYQGQVDEPLSALGKSQLAPAGMQPTVVYVSPLQRARETAALLFPGARQVVVEDLKEIDFGEFDTKKGEELWETDVRYRQWVEDGCKTTPPGGEAMEDYIERNRRAFLSMMEQEERGEREKGGEPVVIVAHGGTQRAILHTFGTERDKSYFDWFLEPANGYVMDWDGHHLSVEDVMDFRRTAEKKEESTGEAEKPAGMDAMHQEAPR